MWTIYKVTNLKSGKLYVGCTSGSLQRRWIDHCSAARANIDMLLYRDMRKMGFEIFKIEKLSEIRSTKKHAGWAEDFWMRKLESHYPKGYNQRNGINRRKLLKTVQEPKAKQSKRTNFTLFVLRPYKKSDNEWTNQIDTILDSQREWYLNPDMFILDRRILYGT